MSSSIRVKALSLAIVALGWMSNPLLAQVPTAETNPPPVTSEQESPSPAPPDHHHHHFDFLSRADQQKLKQARKTVLEDHPDLKTEEEELKTEGKLLHQNPNTTRQERRDFFTKLQAHMAAVRTAMLQQDPSLQPIFDQIDQHINHHVEQAAPSPAPANPNN